MLTVTGMTENTKNKKLMFCFERMSDKKLNQSKSILFADLSGKST